MNFTLSGHGVGSCPAKGRGVHLSTLISTAGMRASKHSVCEGCMWEPLIAKHPVIGQESPCERGVQASADTLLRGPLHSLFGTVQGNHPPACKGHIVYCPWVIFGVQVHSCHHTVGRLSCVEVNPFLPLRAGPQTISQTPQQCADMFQKSTSARSPSLPHAEHSLTH